jgi:branched-chain amino acid transport system ATP-binding protein
MAGNILSVRALNAHYGRAHILHDVEINLGEGEVVALLGRNGAGKSTIMKSVMGLLARRRGNVEFRGRDLGSLRPYEISRLGLAYVPEDRRIFSGLTVLENLEVGRRASKSTKNPWTVERLFALFPNLGERQNADGGRLSGGEQQMLTVARALMGNPQAILLDEPSEGLAPVIVEQMARAVKALKAEGLSVLLSEQNLYFAHEVSDRAYVVDRGRIRHEGRLDAIMANEEIRRAHLAV